MIFALLLSLSGSVGQVPADVVQARATSAAPDIRVEGSRLEYRGELTREGAGRVRGFLERLPNLRSFAIESLGGDMEAGIVIGELIRDRALDVRVVGLACMSSCANYVFPAGRTKTIAPGALVIWHGSAIQDGLWEVDDFTPYEEQKGSRLNWFEKRSLQRQVRRYGDDMRERQAALYESLGVDARITVYGQIVGCNCNWTVSVADMAKFGIADVDAEVEYGRVGSGPRDVEWRLLSLAQHPLEPRVGSK